MQALVRSFILFHDGLHRLLFSEIDLKTGWVRGKSD
jgi:hypothetical protein